MLRQPHTFNAQASEAAHMCQPASKPGKLQAAGGRTCYGGSDSPAFDTVTPTRHPGGVELMCATQEGSKRCFMHIGSTIDLFAPWLSCDLSSRLCMIKLTHRTCQRDGTQAFDVCSHTRPPRHPSKPHKHVQFVKTKAQHCFASIHHISRDPI